MLFFDLDEGKRRLLHSAQLTPGPSLQRREGRNNSVNFDVQLTPGPTLQRREGRINFGKL